MITYKTIDVEIDLNDFSTAEIVEALKKRGDIQEVHGLIDALEIAGCPLDLIKALKDWNRNIVTIQDLQKWIERA